MLLLLKLEYNTGDMKHNAKKILKEHKSLVWPVVKSYLKNPNFPKAFDIPKEYKSEVDYHWKVFKDYPQRQGKYLRPTVLLLTTKAMGGKEKRAVLTAAAMQMSEEWILIHDDVEDNSFERRGKPTLNRMYGINTAINAGDMLHATTWKMTADNAKVIGPELSNKIQNEFFRFYSRTVLGQGIEIKWFEGKLKGYKDKDWELVADSKTGYYSIAGPMRLGAIIAGATNTQLEKLAEFGKYLGRCFQLVDDVLDVTSDFAGLKKQKGNDVFEGKRTVLLGHLLRTIKGKDKKKLIKIMEKKREDKTQKEVDWVIKQMDTLGSIDYAKDLASHYKDIAMEMFEGDLKFLKKQPARDKMETLIHFILERDH